MMDMIEGRCGLGKSHRTLFSGCNLLAFIQSRMIGNFIAAEAVIVM
ncbi:hypothetical protein HMPREF9997_00833 [Corynebacterium durum F0235]|uniref:Uncharacterized protein n=1 Tax=Corynebacterium durum F0235 TaxID=1035195 RepID=L1MJL7_9CORY|nr:hypothetical protein HMPREF9997_00833 [Corynebacterium durum F0235]